MGIENVERNKVRLVVKGYNQDDLILINLHPHSSIRSYSYSVSICSIYEH